MQPGQPVLATTPKILIPTTYDSSIVASCNCFPFNYFWFYRFTIIAARLYLINLIFAVDINNL